MRPGPRPAWPERTAFATAVRQIVSLLRKEGIEVVQLGVVEEEKIAGATDYLNGQTTLEETGLLIKHSLCLSRIFTYQPTMQFSQFERRPTPRKFAAYLLLSSTWALRKATGVEGRAAREQSA
jgi:hypothetical protein